jgi:hypothetical protein
MPAYEIRRPTGNQSWDPVEGVSEGALPCMQCPICGKWATSGFIYPTLEPIGLLEECKSDRYRWLSPAEFTSFISSISHLLHNRPCEPGTEIGHFRGGYTGRSASIVWSHLSHLLFREDLVNTLIREHDIHLVGQFAELHPNSAAPLRYFEPECNMNVRCKGWRELLHCNICMRATQPLPETTVLDASTYNESYYMHCSVDAPTRIIVNHRLYDALKHLAPAECSFREVRLS